MRPLSFTILFILLASAAIAGPNVRFIYHTIEKGETLFSLAKQYGLKPEDIAKYNESVDENLRVHIGQKIKVPVPAEANLTAPAPSEPVNTTAKVALPTPEKTYHTVAKGETVYSISKLYGVTKEELTAWNKIKDNGISLGQKLVIKSKASTATAATPAGKVEVENAIKKDGYTWTLPSESAKNAKTNVSTASGDITASSAPVGLADTRSFKSWKTESTAELREYYNKAPSHFDPTNEYEALFYQNVYSGMPKKTETGVVKLIVDNNNTNIAYYNNASVGTILKLTNNDNGKTTYAIVVGKVAPAEENSYLLKLSGRVGKSLGAKDYSSVEVVCYTGN